MDDGVEFDCQRGDVSPLPSGHDARTVGEEPAVVVDIQGVVGDAMSRECERALPASRPVRSAGPGLRSELPAASPWL
jgi:hypothetical protein